MPKALPLITKLERRMGLDTIKNYTLRGQGEIPYEGMATLRRLVYASFGVHIDIEDQETWPRNWLINKSPNGLPSGTLPKRLANLLFKQHSIKASPSVISTIGSQVAQYVESENVKMRLELTKTLKWSEGEFGDEGSCLYSSGYGGYSCMEGIAYAIKSYRPGSTIGNGRVWLTEMGDKLFLYNAYGPHSLFKYGRLLTQLFGLAYKQVDITYLGETDDEIYINGDGNAVLVGRAHVISPISHWDIGSNEPYYYDPYDDDYYDDDEDDYYDD